MEEEIKDRFEAEQLFKKHGVHGVGKPAGELLMHSARLGIMKLFVFFMKTAPLDYRNKFNDTVLHYAAKGGNAEIVRILVQNNIPQTANLFGELPLFYAVEEGHVQIVEMLGNGEMIAVKDKFGETVLHFAAREGHEEVCRMILKKKRELVNVENENGVTPLGAAIEAGNLNVAEVLQKAGGKMQHT
jgi:ankyrin repeat protein